jgi:glycosyltransferase involved in cell wall biosynthesis
MTPTTLGLFDLAPKRENLGNLELRTFSCRHFNQRWGFPITKQSWHAVREYDILHLMIFPTPLTDLLILSARRHRKKIVLTDVGGGNPCWSTYLQKMHPRLNLNRLAHGLAPLSKHAARFFADWPHPQQILYGGVDLEKFTTSQEAPQGYALFVGRLLPHKGVLPLIQAINPETPLHVVGRPYDQSYFAQLEQAATGKRVQFILDADDAELHRQYLGASVVLQPSIPVNDPASDTSELLGLVTLEAMACGKPVIITRTASLPELVIEGETGFIVPPHDLAAMRGRIDQLVRNPELAQVMGQAARNHIEKNFTWNQVTERGLNFYRRIDPHMSAR